MIKVEELTRKEMIKLMINWADAHPQEPDWLDISQEKRAEGALVELCTEALYDSGRDDWGGCVLCRS